MQPLVFHSELTSGYRRNTYLLENEGGAGGLARKEEGKKPSIHVNLTKFI